MPKASLFHYLTNPARARDLQDGLYAVLVLGVTVALMLFLLGSASVMTSLTIIGFLLCLSLAGSVLRFMATARAEAELQESHDKMDQDLRVLQHRVGDHDLLLMKMAGQMDQVQTDVAAIKTAQTASVQTHQDFMAAVKDRLMMMVKAIGTLKTSTPAATSAPAPSRKKSPPKDFFAPIPAANDAPVTEPDIIAHDTAHDTDIHISPSLIREAIKTALINNRIDVYVQPLATLPQRHVYGYEVTGRIRVDPGLYVSARQYQGLASHDSNMVALDRMVLAQLRPLVKTLKSPRLFLNLTTDALRDAASITHLTQLVLAYPDLKNNLVVWFNGRDMARLNDNLARVMQELQGIGIVFGVNDTSAQDMNLNDLTHRGIRYLKLPADRLVGPATTEEGAAILARFLARLQARNIQLIVGAVENDQTIKTLLDFPVHVAQGHLFGRPDRPLAYPGKARVA